MDINNLLKGVDCSCGKKHECHIDYVYIEKNATLRLREICKEQQHILLVADENTFAAAGEQTVAALSDKLLQKVIFGRKEILVPNEIAIQAVEEKLEGTEMIIGIGSGVIQDLCKYVSFYHAVPYMIVATAPSMDGYASNGAAMITDGMKVTYPAGLPKAILADTEVLKDAPMEMIKAGYGDVIGKFSALNDWKLSHLVNDEYFCQYIYDLTFEQIQKTLHLADGILKRSEESIKALMEALVIIGILMSFAGSSRPASGSEHHLSHFFEITGILTDSPYFPHGIDVAYSTVVTAALREKLLASTFPEKVYRPEQKNYEQEMKRVYRSSAKGCMALQEKMGRYQNNTAKMYLDREAEIRSVLNEMPTADEISGMLSLVELDMQEFYCLYGKDKIRDAVVYAKDLKDRYTVLWMYYDLLGEKWNV